MLVWGTVCSRNNSYLNKRRLLSWSTRNQSTVLNGRVVLNIAGCTSKWSRANDRNKGGSRPFKLTVNFIDRLPRGYCTPQCAHLHLRSQRINLYSHEIVTHGLTTMGRYPDETFSNSFQIATGEITSETLSREHWNYSIDVYWRMLSLLKWRAGNSYCN